MSFREGLHKIVRLDLSERNLSVLAYSLFSAWMLAFLFEGQIFYSLSETHLFDPSTAVFCAVAANFVGLLVCSFIIRSKKAAKQVFLFSFPFFIVVSTIFFFKPSVLWFLGLFGGSFLAGICVAAWAFYLKSGTAKSERFKTVADMLILSNLLMILLNTAAVYISPLAGLATSMFLLLFAFAAALKLPENANTGTSSSFSPPAEHKNSTASVAKILLFLCIFISIITVNSGLMYHVINPAFAHLGWLTSWYWALPYIVALIVMRNLPQRIDRAYILYVAIAMIGLAFIGFMVLGRGVISYLIINTLILGACGVYDLFWWSILADMLEFHKNPARILGAGLSANVFGVLLGGLIGDAISSSSTKIHNTTLLALAVVCVILILLPPLHKRLSLLLKDQAFLTEFSNLPVQEQAGRIERVAKYGNLSERENQVTTLLLQGKTYKMIAAELIISENTVKYYVKNIYSKFGVQSRADLIRTIEKEELKTTTHI